VVEQRDLVSVARWLVALVGSRPNASLFSNLSCTSWFCVLSRRLKVLSVRHSPSPSPTHPPVQILWFGLPHGHDALQELRQEADQLVERHLSALIADLEDEHALPALCLLTLNAVEVLSTVELRACAALLLGVYSVEEVCANDATLPKRTRAQKQALDALETDLRSAATRWRCGVSDTTSWARARTGTTRDKKKKEKKKSEPTEEEDETEDNAAAPPVVRSAVLVMLDRQLQHLPVEGMPALLDAAQPLCRLPSMAFVFYKLAQYPSAQLAILRAEAAPSSGASTPKRTRSAPKQPAIRHPRRTAQGERQAFYLLNPDGSLGNTQTRFQRWFDHIPGWNGVAGQEPSSKELQCALTTHQLFV
jgi:Peptidase family C50